jgi:hypothetical protein
MAEMINLLSRPAKPGWRGDCARLVLLSASLAMGAVAWHLLRPTLVTAVARSSVGCDARHRLLDESLRSVLADRFPQAYWMRSSCGKRERVINLGAFDPDHANHVFFIDDSLRAIGSVTAPSMPGYCDDMDGDGCIEVTVTGCTQMAGTSFSAAVRVSQTNQLLGIVECRGAGSQQSSQATFDVWRDEDGDGLMELVLVAAPVPWRTSSIQPSAIRTIAVFEWTAPGGVLRPRLMPTDGSVTFWSPPDGQPVPFPSDESIDSVIERVRAQSAPPSSGPSLPPAVP